jgi:hypothetical protein
MNAFVRIEKYKDTDKGTDLIISVPIKGLGEVLSKKRLRMQKSGWMMDGIYPPSSVKRHMRRSGT